MAHRPILEPAGPAQRDGTEGARPVDRIVLRERDALIGGAVIADQHWLDGLSRALARGVSRKQFLGLLGSAALATFAPPSVSPAQAQRRRCRDGCEPPFPDCCDDLCTNLQLDVSNCRVCGRKCNPGEACRGGECLQPAAPPTPTPCQPAQEFVPGVGCVPKCDPPCGQGETCRDLFYDQSVCCAPDPAGAPAGSEKWFSCGETCCMAERVCCEGACFEPGCQCCEGDCCKPHEICLPGGDPATGRRCCPQASYCDNTCCVFPERHCDPVDGRCRPFCSPPCPEGHVCCDPGDSFLGLQPHCVPRAELRNGECCGRSDRWGTMSQDPSQSICCNSLTHWCNGVCCADGEICREGTCIPISPGMDERCDPPCPPELQCCGDARCCECCPQSDRCGRKQYLDATGPDGQQLWTCVEENPPTSGVPWLDPSGCRDLRPSNMTFQGLRNRCDGWLSVCGQTIKIACPYTNFSALAVGEPGPVVCCDRWEEAKRTKVPCDPLVDFDCDGIPNDQDNDPFNPGSPPPRRRS